MSIDSPPGPDGFMVATGAEVTVVMYAQHKVKASHAYKYGQLTEKGIEAITNDLPKILPVKK